MFSSARFSATVVTALTASFLVTTTQTSRAATVTATAGVPNGMTSYQGTIQWSLNRPDELPEYFEFDYTDSLTGNQIVSVMESEVESSSSFEGNVSGNAVTFDNVEGNLGLAPGEVDMTWEVDLMGGSLPPQPDLPIKDLPHPWSESSFSLFIAGPEGNSVPIQSDGELLFSFILGGRDPIEGAVALQASEFYTTEDLNRELDDHFRMATLPAGVRYRGLNNGFPNFTAEEDFNFSVNILVRSASDPGFNVGYIAYGAVPEPSTVALSLLGGLGCLAIRFRRSWVSVG